MVAEEEVPGAHGGSEKGKGQGMAPRRVEEVEEWLIEASRRL